MKNSTRNLTKSIGYTVFKLSPDLYRAKVSINIIQKSIVSIFLTLTFFTYGIAQSHAALTFASTTDPSAWQIATHLHGTDGLLSSFDTTNFATATAISATPGRDGWIANNSTGTNSSFIGDWTFFVFRQTFDLTNYDASTANLKFQWAADDSGQVFAERGSWVPKFSLNDGPLTDGSWAGGYSYVFGNETTLTDGFVSGINHIDFYVEGNGVTDGFALKTLSFTAAPIPEPEAYAMLLAGLGLLGFAARRRKESAV